jgi:hypothetical protein
VCGVKEEGKFGSGGGGSGGGPVYKIQRYILKPFMDRAVRRG